MCSGDYRKAESGWKSLNMREQVVRRRRGDVCLDCKFLHLIIMGSKEENSDPNVITNEIKSSAIK